MADEDKKKREVKASDATRRRSVAIALLLGALVVMFYLATMVRLGGNVINRAM